jgi:hypothetical protein
VRIAFAALLLAASLARAASAAPDAGALAAIRLPTLAERVAKLHAQVGQGILAQRSRRALAETLRDFDAALRAAAAAAPNAEARDNYTLLGLLWQDYREFAQRPATRENARKLRERTEEVEWVAAKGARAFHEHSRAGANASAVRAEQAALLSQRIAKLYLWRQWDLRDERAARELRESEENLGRALDALRAATDNTPQIAAELESAQGQLRFMADAAAKVEARQDAGRQIEFIAKTGDHILESMQRAARLYAGGAP